MPTDTDLRALFRDIPTPKSTIDTEAVIRRSKRRRLPQQLGAGSALTLAVAGIGVASINGIRAAAPMSASDMAGTSPTSVSEGAPFSEGAPIPGADSSVPERQVSCEVGGLDDAAVDTDLRVGVRFPAAAPTGGSVAGAITLTNSSAEPISGVAVAPAVSVTGPGTQLTHSDRSANTTPVSLGAGESIALEFSFEAVACEPGGRAGASLNAGEYELAATVTFLPEHGQAIVVGGPPSAIALR